jgi:TPR repeat protein
MLLAAVLLSATLHPQEPPPVPETPPPTEPATAEAAPAPPTQAAIDDGLAAFRKRRFKAAQAAFERAAEADPGSAAAAFYLGYTCYKIGEPSRRMNANKERAKELFAKAFSLDPAFRPVWGPPPPR